MRLARRNWLDLVRCARTGVWHTRVDPWAARPPFVAAGALAALVATLAPQMSAPAQVVNAGGAVLFSWVVSREFASALSRAIR